MKIGKKVEIHIWEQTSKFLGVGRVHSIVTIGVKDRVGGQVEDRVENQVWELVGKTVWELVGNQARNQND